MNPNQKTFIPPDVECTSKLAHTMSKYLQVA